MFNTLNAINANPVLAKGRERLALLKDDLRFTLKGSVRGVGSSEELRIETMLSNPDELLPVEVVGEALKPREPLTPDAPRLWLWDPFDPSAPGWTAHRVVELRACATKAHPWGLVVSVESREHGQGDERYFFDGDVAHEEETPLANPLVQKALQLKGIVLDLKAHYPSLLGADGRWKAEKRNILVSDLLSSLQGSELSASACRLRQSELLPRLAPAKLRF